MMTYNDNPFKILNVSLTDTRREIASKTEEKTLLFDARKCTDAQTILTNPQRRISAEVHWFLDCSDEKTKKIDSYISNTLAGNEAGELPCSDLCALTQLNIRLACLEAQDFISASAVRHYILDISSLFEDVDAEEVRELINEKRRQAAFPEVSKTRDVEDALAELRSEIRQALSQRLQSLPDNLYTRIVTLLSESYSGSSRYKGQAVLEDILSEYQLYINEALQKQGQLIIKTADYIAIHAPKIDVSTAVSDLVESLYDWDKLAQPLQLGALTQGSSHEESEEMLSSLRGLALKLHNDYGLSNESLAITKAIQEVFKELPEYADLLSNDNRILSRLIKEKESGDVLDSLLKTVSDACEVLKTCPESQRSAKTNELIRCIKDANQQILKQYPDKKTADSMRLPLGILARSFAIELHNDHQRTDESIQIINAIDPLFSDLPKLTEELKEDKKALRALKEEQEATDAILASLKTIDNSLRPIKTASGDDRSKKITALITQMVDLDKTIKAKIGDEELQNQMRERLAYMVRSVGIELHNVCNDSDNALRVITAVKYEFSDLPKLVSVLDKDIHSLNRQISNQIIAAERKKKQEADRKARRRTWGIIAAAVLIAFGIHSYKTGELQAFLKPAANSYTTTSTTPRPKTMPTAKPSPSPSPKPLLTPSNGRVFLCTAENRPSSFKVTNGSSSNYFMKFVKAGTDTTVIAFFVRGNSTATIDMPTGTFELRYAYGTDWYGIHKLFGENTRYAKDEEYYEFTRTKNWSISLYASLDYEQKMDVKNISADEF